MIETAFFNFLIIKSEVRYLEYRIIIQAKFISVVLLLLEDPQTIYCSLRASKQCHNVKKVHISYN